MMKRLFDNHNHSHFSFDGKRTSIEKSAISAYSKGLGGICFSDHCDFYVPPMKAEFEDLIPEQFDVAAQQEEVDRVQSLIDAMCLKGGRGFRILKGIEIGMYDECRDDIRKTLESNSFDQIIASVHYIDQTDPYYGGYYDDKDWKTAYGRYLETIYREMTWLKDFDIMGHYDYIARYAPYEKESIFYRDFSDIFDEMFRYLIQEGKALEINTKSYQDYHGRRPELDREILLRYHEMGGEIVSLGSDSHDPQRPGTDFPIYAGLLKSLGFRWSAHYESRKLVQIPL